ncbi:NADAR family protein [Deinococcus sp. KNUC1210]|uniref:NADAR family protein n=1 Tax=Deinococcus sp. KNUC1210 TaxID=2917691 RepID=UPI001EF0D19B|nr:NADAR family protein [Deinococcus sp. KNUC1210]ULH14695.1 NADAR family protein [Deinococcus sp. KNUC1210]
MPDLDADTLFFYRASHPFSNFYPSKFVVDGLLFHWAEQSIMYRKALHFGDTASARKIMQAYSPAECKKLGRQVQGFDEAGWALVREQVAFDTVLHKFQHNRKLRAVLLQTGSALLVEAAPSDRIWGIGFSEQDALAYRFQWGENLLGKALMRVRDELRD